MTEIIGVTCSKCTLKSDQPVDAVMVTDVAGVLHLAWGCRCGLGHWSTSDPTDRALIEASGVTVVRDMPFDGLLGRAPEWPEVRPKMAPITRLRRLLGRGPKPDA